eukprot:627845-Hanusia_phi.AAC.1
MTSLPPPPASLLPSPPSCFHSSPPPRSLTRSLAPHPPPPTLPPQPENLPSGALRHERIDTFKAPWLSMRNIARADETSLACSPFEVLVVVRLHEVKSHPRPHLQPSCQHQD